MGYPLSIEDPDSPCFITNRTVDSRLWFINDHELEKIILGILARYANIYNVVLYAFIIMGNHYHLTARFPFMNRAAFMRDLNAATARLIGRRIKVHGRRSVWARRYRSQALPRDLDLHHWFYYSSLNPVSSGITENVNQYCTYNSFEDSSNGTVRTYKYTEWAKYNDAKRRDPSVRVEDYTFDYPLKFERLPGLEHLSPKEYRRKLREELLERQNIIVLKRRADGKGFLGMDRVRQILRGSRPRHTKMSTRNSKTPLCLTLCSTTRKRYLTWYFHIRRWYLDASRRYRAGELGVEFPPGTYPPSRGLVRELPLAA